MYDHRQNGLSDRPEALRLDPTTNGHPPIAAPDRFPPDILTPIAQLAETIGKQRDEGLPAIKFPGSEVEAAARQHAGPMCLLSTILDPDQGYKVLDPNVFVGVTSDANLSESALNPDPHSNAHFHWEASESLILIKGRVRLYAWRGKKLFVTEAVAGDILHVPLGVPHKLEIPTGEPTVVYVVRAPAAVSGYKQAWPPKTKP